MTRHERLQRLAPYVLAALFGANFGAAVGLVLLQFLGR